MQNPDWIRTENMQFIDLAAQQKRIRESIDRNIENVLSHGKYVMGPEIGKLEDRLAKFSGVKHAIGCSSGTDALLLSLMAREIGPGDAIFTTPFTFFATAEVIRFLGAIPVFVDVDPETFNIDPDNLEKAIQSLRDNDSKMHPLPRENGGPSGLKAKGVIAVDLFGLPADYSKINEIAKKYGLFVVEDAAQAFGAEYFGKKAGSLADIGCTSFFPAKPLGCYGDGGMCFTDDDGLAQTIRSLLVHGQGTDKYDNARIGINGRLDTLQAAILLAKFEVFEEEIGLRNKVADEYNRLLETTDSVKTPAVNQGFRSVWAQYSLLAKDGNERTRLQGQLKAKGIPTAVYYPKPLHLQTAFKPLGYSSGDFPVSEDFSSRIFSLPMHPYLASEDIESICSTINE